MLLFPRCARAVSLAGLIWLVAAPSPAEEKFPVERKMNDRQIIDLLAAIHDRGALLYNAGDFAGCYRLFEGALITVRPLLPREMQEMIAVGIPDAERQPGMARRAMLLHELVEAVRVKLRPTAGPAAEKLTQPRPVPSGGKKGGDPDFDSKKGKNDAKKGQVNIEEPPPPVRLPTLGTPTKAALPGETPEPGLVIPNDDNAKPAKNSNDRYKGGIDTGRPIEFDPPPITIPSGTPVNEPKDGVKASPAASDKSRIKSIDIPMPPPDVDKSKIEPIPAPAPVILKDESKPVPAPASKPRDEQKPAALPASTPKDKAKPGQTPPIVIGGGDSSKLDPPPLISPKDVAPTSPAPPSPKPKDDGKQPPPPIVIPIPDGK